MVNKIEPDEWIAFETIKWIKFSELEPCYNYYYIVTVEYEDTTLEHPATDRYTTVAWWNGTHWYAHRESTVERKNVVAWAELPYHF